MENAETKKSPKLEASINLSENSLQIEYKVKNLTQKPIYLFNVLWEQDNQGKRSLAKESVYVSLAGDKTLHLSKQIPALPESKMVELRLIPYLTKIEAGGEFSEKISLPLPLEEFNPYFPKKPNSTFELQAAESVLFRIQFIRESEELKLSKAPIENAWSVSHPDLFGNVETLSSNPKACIVRINVRTDKFERF